MGNKLREEGSLEDQSSCENKERFLESDYISAGKQTQYIEMIEDDIPLRYTDNPQHGIENHDRKKEWTRYFRIPFDCDCFNPASLFWQEVRHSFVYLGNHGVGAWKTGTVPSDVVLVNLTK